MKTITKGNPNWGFANSGWSHGLVVKCPNCDWSGQLEWPAEQPVPFPTPRPVSEIHWTCPHCGLLRACTQISDEEINQRMAWATRVSKETPAGEAIDFANMLPFVYVPPPSLGTRLWRWLTENLVKRLKRK